MYSFRNWLFALLCCVAVLAIATHQKSVAAKDVETAPAVVAAPAMDPARIPKLIQLLGDPQYTARETAQAELARFGVDAFDALTEAANHSDIEIASRANYLLRRILIQIESDADSSKIKRILQGYSLADADGRFAKALKLAGLMHNEGLAPLCRLVRYEKSLLMSKQCALLILSQTTANAEERGQRAKVIDRELAASDRAGARWLRCYLQLENDPEAALAQWQTFFDTEIAALKKTDGETSSDVVMALGRHGAGWLQERNRKDDATVVMRKMVSVERGNPATLIELSDWLLQMDAVAPESELIGRFATAFRADPKLYYFVAEARRREGNAEEAEKCAKQASDLIPADGLEERFQLAENLKQRGLFTWAEREFRRIIEAAKGEDSTKEAEEGISARYTFATMLHDINRDEEATEILKPIVDAIAADPNVAQKLQTAALLSASKLRSTANFYAACHFKSIHDAEQEWKFLQAAHNLERTDSDVLIAMFRASTKNQQRRQEVVESIAQAADQFLRRINSQNDDIQSYNEYAWLIGNTVGDYDKAIAYSQKSIELTMEGRREFEGNEEVLSLWPGSMDREPAGLIDTLAHCYAGKGDYENAVKHQARAAKLDPHSIAIVNALDEFKAKLAESRAKQ